MEVTIIGAGGFSREIFQYVQDLGGVTVKGFLDDGDPAKLKVPQGHSVIGGISSYQPSEGEMFMLAVGDPTSRARIAGRFIEAGGRFPTVIHPRAYIASSATIGEGSIIAPFASVGAYATLGALTQVHFYASVAHDAVIGDYAALSPYSVVNGGGRLGEGAFLGTAAIVNPTKSVGQYSKLTAGSVVYQDVPDFSIAAGNPAKARRLMPAADAAEQR